jgi:hypothetical protein
VSLLMDIAPGGEIFLPFAKRKIAQWHDMMSRAGIGTLARTVLVDDGTRIYVNIAALGRGLFRDRINITMAVAVAVGLYVIRSTENGTTTIADETFQLLQHEFFFSGDSGATWKSLGLLTDDMVAGASVSGTLFSGDGSREEFPQIAFDDVFYIAHIYDPASGAWKSFKSNNRKKWKQLAAPVSFADMHKLGGYDAFHLPEAWLSGMGSIDALMGIRWLGGSEWVAWGTTVAIPHTSFITWSANGVTWKYTEGVPFFGDAVIAICRTGPLGTGALFVIAIRAIDESTVSSWITANGGTTWTEQSGLPVQPPGVYFTFHALNLVGADRAITVAI